jgi:hypothetical protein
MLGWLMGCVKQATWANFLYFLYMLIVLFHGYLHTFYFKISYHVPLTKPDSKYLYRFS